MARSKGELSYADRLIAGMAPEKDTFEVQVVDEEGDRVSFPPIEFKVSRDYEEFDKVVKAAAKFASNVIEKKLPADILKQVHEISEEWSSETLSTAYTLSKFVVDQEEWTVFEFMKLAKKLGWVFIYLESGWRAKQMRSLPDKDLQKIEAVKKD